MVAVCGLAVAAWVVVEMSSTAKVSLGKILNSKLPLMSKASCMAALPPVCECVFAWVCGLGKKELCKRALSTNEVEKLYKCRPFSIISCQMPLVSVPLGRHFMYYQVALQQ